LSGKTSTPNRNSCSQASSGTTLTFSHGVRPICLQSLGSWLSTDLKSTRPLDLSSKSSGDLRKIEKQAIEVEVCKLLAAGFIRECQHPVWLANLVLVLKKTGGLRMCIDYTDLNKHCSKDPFPLPRID
jgi:hypothetical protein